MKISGSDAIAYHLLPLFKVFFLFNFLELKATSSSQKYKIKIKIMFRHLSGHVVTVIKETGAKRRYGCRAEQGERPLDRIYGDALQGIVRSGFT